MLLKPLLESLAVNPRRLQPSNKASMSTVVALCPDVSAGMRTGWMCGCSMQVCLSFQTCHFYSGSISDVRSRGPGHQQWQCHSDSFIGLFVIYTAWLESRHDPKLDARRGVGGVFAWGEVRPFTHRLYRSLQ